MSIVAFKNYRKGIQFLAKSKNSSYIFLGLKDEVAKGLLKEYSHAEIDINDCTGKFKEKIFNDYINLIGQLGKELNSIFWWGSFTSSKNRFVSKLLPDLLTYYSICKVISKNKSKDIFLLNPSQQIMYAIKCYCQINSIKFMANGFAPFYFFKIWQNGDYLLRNLYSIIISWYKIFFAKKYFKNNFEKSPKNQQYYVLRTMVYPSSINNDYVYNDSFLGRLPNFLISKNENLIILSAIIGNFKKTAKKLSKCKEYFIIPQEYFLKYSDVLETAIKVLFYKNRLKRQVLFNGMDVSNLIQMEMNNNFKKYALINLLQKNIIINMLKYYNIHTFTTTYENNPWEKVCFLSLRQYSPSTKIIGYQHAVVTKASANMFVSKEEMPIIPMPDKIITVGEVTKGIMEKYGYYPLNRIFPSCALRYEYIYKLKKKEFSKKNRILVALEGVTECYRLVNFVFNGLKDTKDYKVEIRTHPERPFNKIKNDLSFNIDLYDNFSTSNQKTLMDDLNANDILIYWGSTVSLEALMMGLPVVHVDLNDLVSVDPLFDCGYLKWAISEPKELLRVISEIYGLPKESYIDQYSKARAYIEKYLQKSNDEKLKEFIL